jgi:hypothetical protein
MFILFLIAAAVAAYFVYMHLLNKHEVEVVTPPVVTPPVDETDVILPPTLPTVPSTHEPDPRPTGPGGVHYPIP